MGVPLFDTEFFNSSEALWTSPRRILGERGPKRASREGMVLEGDDRQVQVRHIGWVGARSESPEVRLEDTRLDPHE